MILLFIGPKGSGKDTQAAILEKNHGFVNISTGSLIRDEIRNKTELGMKSKELYDAGKYVTDELVFAILRKHLEELDTENIILNGVVRNTEQIGLTRDMLAEIGKQIDLVVYFDLSDQEAITRLSNRWTCPVDNTVYHTVFDPPHQEGICDKCGSKLVQREDDKPEAVKNRLNEDRTKNAPVIEHYREQNMLKEIDASKSIDEVSAEIEAIVTEAQ
ncbi:MAG: Adenylate kinase [candidate division WS6 bacterium OLB20]|uniref:Adenylate kinase n=1 Tax=candidate division WS6 bacterium OLB20 TaxID=1617426 RepID=A0A136LZ58_9BACT|nr:MAG: Adenylate kinase [candidate division WS6 bacterium OLB20]